MSDRDSAIAATMMLGVALLLGCATNQKALVEGGAPSPFAVSGQQRAPGPGRVSGAGDHQSVPTQSAPEAQEHSAATDLPAPATGRSAMEDYRIGPHDLLQVQVFQVEELSRQVRVNSRGDVSMPLIGNIHAAGLTSEQLEKKIAAALSKDFLQDPYVSIFITEYTSQRVTIEGSVNKPGIYPLKGRTTLLQAVAMAEGIERLADTNSIKLFRVGPNGEKKMDSFDLEEIRTGKAQDPIVQGDDIIVVEESGTKSFVKGVTDTLRGFIGFRPIY